ncbi:MAG: hypothetical protein ABSB67_11000 [Bryobacteraceae bacterium]
MNTFPAAKRRIAFAPAPLGEGTRVSGKMLNASDYYSPERVVLRPLATAARVHDN